MAAYYNEHDRFAAAWLRELIKAGLIADGEVDERDIQDVRADDLRGFVQCHFFAGIGGWSYALRLAGWSDDRLVWTGSCPCQPFSSAGKAHGADDSRHLWPAWFHLITELRPGVIFGEQVASPDGLAWLDLVHVDMEAADYAVGAFDLCAAGVGAPHVRQRIYFVGDRAWSNADRSETNWGYQCDPVGRFGRQAHDAQILNPSRSLWATEPRPAVLAHGVPSRVERVCGYGNAIVPQLGATFIEAYMSLSDVVDLQARRQAR